jgi:hypothetical protein
MSAKILQFPKRIEPDAQHIADACIEALRHMPMEPEVKRSHGLRLVKAGEQPVVPDYSLSQQQATRIVLESRQDVMGLKEKPYLGSAVFNERSPQFWATLPVPETHTETPLTVARRLAHLILSSATPA